MAMLDRSPSRLPAHVSFGAVALAVALMLVGAQSAGATWESPVQIAPSSQYGAIDGAAASIGMYDSNIALGYMTSNQAIFAKLRDKGAAAYTDALAVGSTSGTNTLVSPAITVSAQGQAFAAWGLDATDTANDAAQCATRGVGAGAFTACSSNLLGPPGLSSGNWHVGWLSAASNGAGNLAVAFEGPGGSGYSYSRAYGAYGGLADNPPTTAITGNIGVNGAGMSNNPQVAINAAGDAMAISTNWPTNVDHAAGVAYRDHLGSGWYVRPSGSNIYCCTNYGAGNFRLALDDAGNGYVIIGGGNVGDVGARGIVFAYAARDYALGGAGSWGTQQQLDLASSARDPRIAVDSAGNATAIWVDADLATGHDALYVAYRPAGAGTTFGTPVEATVAPGSGQISRDELVVDPSGKVTVAWIVCIDAGCTGRAVQAVTRAPGGGAFDQPATLASSATSKGGLTLAGDPQGGALAAWSEGGSKTIYASMYTSSSSSPPLSLVPVPVSDPGGSNPAVAPLISDLAVRPASFRAAVKGGSIAAASSTGATVSYFESLAATTTFTIARKERGVKFAGRCVARSQKHSHGKACTRSVALRGRFTRRDTAGSNSFRFTGRLNRKSLAPGSYTLTGSPLAADGTVGISASVDFRIKR